MRIVKAVLDTNVVVSAHLKRDGRESLIVELALSGKFKFAVSEGILDEYEGVLRRPPFNLNPHLVKRSLGAIRNRALFVQPRTHLQIISDPDDNKVLECALEAGADYVVTGNLRHFPRQYRGIRILAPREFLEILATRLE